jgi:hypothetical protein
MNRCRCRHLEAQHDIALVDGVWVPDPGAGCVWRTHPHLNRSPQTGATARPCPCETYEEMPT